VLLAFGLVFAMSLPSVPSTAIVRKSMGEPAPATSRQASSPTATHLRNFANFNYFFNPADPPPWLSSHGWSYLTPYVSLLITGPGANAWPSPTKNYNELIHAAGIGIMLYSDPNLCSGVAAANGFTSMKGFTNPSAFPDCSQITDLTAFYYKPGTAATPQSIITTVEGSYEQLYGNPGSTSFQNSWRAQISSLLTQQLAGDGFQYDFIEIDDAGDPANNGYSPKWLCYGFAPKPTASCVPGNGTHPSGPQATSAPWAQGYNLSGWVIGEADLGAYPFVRYNVPAVYNGMGAGADEESIHLAPGTKAALTVSGGSVMCEACLGGTNPYVLADNVSVYTAGAPTFLYDKLNDALQMEKKQRPVFYIGDDPASVSPLQQVARMMLVSSTANLYYEGACSNAKSQIPACIESALQWADPVVPLSSIASPKNIFVPTVAGGQVGSNPGFYLREYADCFYFGRPIGACAAIASDDDVNSVAIPSYLKNKYPYTIRSIGTSLCSCYGDPASTLTFGTATPAWLAAVGSGKPYPMAAILVTAQAAAAAGRIEQMRWRNGLR
jgi:hypothetical protein